MRLGAGFGAVLALMLVLAGLSVRVADRAQTSVSGLVGAVESVAASNRLSSAANAIDTAISAYLLDPGSPQIAATLQRSRADFDTAAHAFRAQLTAPEHAQSFAALESAMVNVWRSFDVVQQKTGEALRVTAEAMEPTGAELLTAVSRLVDEANAAGVVPARASARQAKVELLEARLGIVHALATLRLEDQRAADAAIDVVFASLGKAAANPDCTTFQPRFAQLQPVVDRLRSSFTTVVTRRQEVAALRSGELTPQQATAMQCLAATVGAITSEATSSGAEAVAGASASKVSTASIGALVALVGIVMAVLIARGITRPIQTLVRRIGEIQASKDLTRRVQMRVGGEIGQLADAFDAMVGTLHAILAEVKNGSQQIDLGGHHISNASQQLASAASQQAMNLQQISSALEEMSSMTQNNAESAKEASALGDGCMRSVKLGHQEMECMVQAVTDSEKAADEIRQILKVIDAIAFQTNLLALNAAVEAARAGDAGKGFAVVAEEVRNLAQRSAEAARSTGALIETSNQSARRGAEVAARVSANLTEITTNTTRVSEILNGIAVACQEQALGIKQINESTATFDRSTQQTAGNSEELAAAAEQMSSQVTCLRELVGQFRVDG